MFAKTVDPRAIRTRGSYAQRMRTCVEVLSVPVDPVTWDGLCERVATAAANHVRNTVMYANVHVLNTAQRTPGLVDALRGADVVYCDGEGVRVAARLLGESLPERMTGADFIWDLARRLGESGLRIFWLGGAPGTADRATQLLAEKHPGLTISGTHHGFFEKVGAESDAVIARINECQPAVVFVGMGTPTQELWVARNRAQIDAPVVWCVGATADFIAQVQGRGPEVLTQNGFEWLARLASDPQRLFRRYVVGNPLFLARVLQYRVRRSR
jgi:N-acetylglucosaminyldiphosphoundecaprenol N-acetyl-beta-D-mannosaminyltransferase